MYKSKTIKEHIRTKQWTKFWFSNSPIFFHQVLKALILWHKGFVGDEHSNLFKGRSKLWWALSVVIFVVAAVNFSPFSSTFPEPQVQFQPKLAQSFLRVMGIQFCSNKRPPPFPKVEKNEIAKIHWRNIYIFFYRTTGLTPTKLGAKRPWVKGVQVSIKNKETFNSLKEIMLFTLLINVMVCR